jgi:hypothetical protein
MSSTEAENLIAHLSRRLAPDEREHFRCAAETALATASTCWGPGSVYRTLVPLWRQFFQPPPNCHDRGMTWSQARRASKLVSEPPLAHGRDRRPHPRRNAVAPRAPPIERQPACGASVCNARRSSSKT